MGFISRFKCAQSFQELERVIKNQGATLAVEFPNLEPFEYLVLIWKSQMQQRGKTELAMHGEHFVHFWAILPNPKTALELLARQIATYVVPDFGESSYFAELNSGLGPMVESIKADGGSKCNALFNTNNPIAYSNFVQKHGRGPFTPAPPLTFG